MTDLVTSGLSMGEAFAVIFAVYVGLQVMIAVWRR